MCGILGDVSTTSPRDLSTDKLKQILGHRGPDGGGLLRDQHFGHHLLLGHRRLSILDISSAGAQPMSSHDGRWVVVYNGEIYNHKELRKVISISFQSSCDTETLVEAISKWGFSSTLARLNGIFAFAAFDRVEGKLWLARDASGIKPLYHKLNDNGISFASEIRALSAVTDIDGMIDQNALEQFLSYRYVPSPLTLWKGVSRLSPGHMACYNLNNKKFISRPFEYPHSIQFRGTMKDATDIYGSLLSKAVERQLMSDVPLGILLSGGIDSAMVAALAVRAGARPLAYTVGFGGEYPECEIADAQHTAHTLGLEHRTVSINSASAWNGLFSALESTEEPLGTTSLIPMWSLCELAGRDVKVVLSGQGSDELWGGYRRYQGELIGNLIPRSAVWGILASLTERLGPRAEVLARALRGLTTAEPSAHLAQIYALFSDKELRNLGQNVNPESQLAPLKYWLSQTKSFRQSDMTSKMMSLDLRMNLSDDLLLYSDKISMAHSIEARFPLLDLEVVSFVESLPRHMRVALLRPKRAHRKAAQHLLPQTIIDRPKLGFQVPFGAWIRSQWREEVGSLLLDNRSLGQLVDIKGVETIWNQHLMKKRDRSRQLFALLALSVWANRWQTI